MEQAPEAKAQIREMAQANANPETKIVARKATGAWVPAGDRAGEKAKVQAPVRVKEEERGKAAGGRPEYFHRHILNYLQHWEAA